MTSVCMMFKPFLTRKSLATIFARKWSLAFMNNHHVPFQVSKAIEIVPAYLTYVIFSFMNASYMIDELWLSFKSSTTYLTTVWRLLLMN